MWKQETLHSLHRFLRNTRSFCDPYLDRNGDDHEEEENTLSTGSMSNGSLNQMFREIQHGLVLTTTQSREELTYVNPTHISEGFEFMESNLQSTKVDTVSSSLFAAAEITKADDEGQCDCLDDNLSVSIASENDCIHESQGHTPKGASDSVKTPRGKVGSNKIDRSSSFIVALRLCAFLASAVLCVVVMSETRNRFFAQVDTFQIRWNATYCAGQMYSLMEMIEAVFNRAYNHPIWQHSFRRMGLPRLPEGSDDHLLVYLFHVMSRVLRDAHAKFLRDAHVKYLYGVSTPWAHGHEIVTSVAQELVVFCNIQLPACQLFVLQRAKNTGCVLENLYLSIQRQYRMTEKIDEERYKYFLGEMFMHDQVAADATHANDMDTEPLLTSPTIEQTDTIFVQDDGAMFDLHTRVGSKVEHVVSAMTTKQQDTDRNPGAAFLRFVESDFYNLEALPAETLQVTAVAHTNDMRAVRTDLNHLLNQRSLMDFPQGPQKEALEPKSLLAARVIEPDNVCWSEEFAIDTADKVWSNRGIEAAETSFVSSAYVDDHQEQPEVTANVKSCEVHAEITDKETTIKEYQTQQESPKVQTSAKDDEIESEFPTPRQCFTRRCLARQQFLSVQQVTGDE